jgi:hypothetical protein
LKLQGDETLANAAFILHLSRYNTVTQHGGMPVEMVIDDMDDTLERKYEAEAVTRPLFGST